MSYSLHCSGMGISSFIQCVGVTQLVSGFLSERTAARVGVDSAYPREELMEAPVLLSWAHIDGIKSLLLVESNNCNIGSSMVFNMLFFS